jgi:hypothetical protein
MVADIDIWRTARLIMQQRDEPEFYAAQRADELLGAGDLEGNRVWRRIGMAVRNLSERDPVCSVCNGARWVCDNHPDRPWAGKSRHESACECGAGMSCPKCNQGSRRAPHGIAN